MAQNALVFSFAALIVATLERPAAGYSGADVTRCYSGAVLGPQSHPACYAAMARHPAAATVAPFAFRPLIPDIVHFLPGPTWVGFHLVTTLALAGAAVLLYDLVARDLGRLLGVIALVAFGLSGAVQMPLRQPDMVDSSAVLAGAITLWLCRRSRWVWAALVVAVGIAAHETAGMFVVPLVASAWSTKRARALVLAVPAVAVYVLIHFTPLLYGHVVPAFPLLSSQNLAYIAVAERTAFGGPMQAMGNAVMVSLGMGWLLVALGWRRSPAHYRLMAAALIPALASWTIEADYDRMLSIGAVAAIPVLCHGVTLHRRRSREMEAPPPATVATLGAPSEQAASGVPLLAPD